MMTLFRRLLPLAFLIPLVLSGCDTADTGGDGDTFLLPTPPNHSASFVYSAGTLTADQMYSEGRPQSSQGVINDMRFGPSDVASARVRSGTVELNMDFPVGADQAIMIDEATLTLSAPGVGDQIVARASDVSLSILTTNAQLRRATLDLSDADITEFVQQDSFTGTLTLRVGAAGTSSYQFTVTFDVDVEVNI